jgi:hypothetical protein
MKVVSGVDLEPTIPAEAAQALFKMSNGNVCMRTRLGKMGWERALICDDCGKIQSVESLIVLERDDEAAFARILAFCAQHKHDSHTRSANLNKEVFETVKMDSVRRIKEI